MFLIFLLFVILTDVFGYYLADLTLSPKPQTDLYEKCLTLRKIVYDNQCWELLTKGPCDTGQWLVLDSVDGSDGEGQTVRVKAKCAKRRCSESDVYWPSDGFCYDADAPHRHQLCPHQNTVLTTDGFGDGYCECQNSGSVPYVRFANGDDEHSTSWPCYRIYDQGPCPRGQVFTPDRWGYGNCTVDRCVATRLDDEDYLDRQRPTVATVAPWTDGRCYELGSRGPCASHEQFAILRDAMRPGCEKMLTVLDLFSNKGQPCLTDHRGQCVDGVNVEQPNGTDYLAQLLEMAKRRNERVDVKKKRTA